MLNVTFLSEKCTENSPHPENDFPPAIIKVNVYRILCGLQFWEQLKQWNSFRVKLTQYFENQPKTGWKLGALTRTWWELLTPIIFWKLIDFNDIRNSIKLWKLDLFNYRNANYLDFHWPRNHRTWQTLIWTMVKFQCAVQSAKFNPRCFTHLRDRSLFRGGAPYLGGGSLFFELHFGEGRYKKVLLRGGLRFFFGDTYLPRVLNSDISWCWSPLPLVGFQFVIGCSLIKSGMRGLLNKTTSIVNTQGLKVVSV